MLNEVGLTDVAGVTRTFCDAETGGVVAGPAFTAVGVIEETKTFVEADDETEEVTGFSVAMLAGII